MSVSSPRGKRTQYRQIEKTDRDRRADERAREVATRTAMTQRREQENNNHGNGAAGDQAPGPASLEAKSVKQLRDRASELLIKGRSTMRKRELILAIRMAIH